MSKINIFETKADILVNPVNTRGISGCGLALQFKKRFPEAQKLYEEACRENRIKLGVPYLIQTNSIAKYIVCFPTKVAPDRKEKTTISTISKGLHILRSRCLDEFFPSNYSIAIPMLGCGAGGLSEKEVLPVIKNVMSDVKQTIIICS